MKLLALAASSFCNCGPARSQKRVR
jgi:hypothetical protein